MWSSEAKDSRQVDVLVGEAVESIISRWQAGM